MPKYSIDHEVQARIEAVHPTGSAMTLAKLARIIDLLDESVTIRSDRAEHVPLPGFGFECYSGLLFHIVKYDWTREGEETRVREFKQALTDHITNIGHEDYNVYTLDEDLIIGVEMSTDNVAWLVTGHFQVVRTIIRNNDPGKEPGEEHE